MASTVNSTSHLVNALARPEQLAHSNSQQDGVSAELERSMLFAGARLTQTAGILLRLPQDIVAQAIVIFQRFWIGSDGGSLKDHDVQVSRTHYILGTAKRSSAQISLAGHIIGFDLSRSQAFGITKVTKERDKHLCVHRLLPNHLHRQTSLRRGQLGRSLLCVRGNVSDTT